ncbi:MULTISPECIES: hypothetical protein [Acidiphilium]|nr:MULTISPECIES: hypothetical protein [Acidiphilium]HQT84247.1 hypothetical protein [Acidiphilium rubrum]
MTDPATIRAIGFGLAVHERGTAGLSDIVINPPDHGHDQARQTSTKVT